MGGNTRNRSAALRMRAWREVEILRSRCLDMETRLVVSIRRRDYCRLMFGSNPNGLKNCLRLLGVGRFHILVVLVETRMLVISSSVSQQSNGINCVFSVGDSVIVSSYRFW